TPYFVPGLDLPHFRIILGLENAIWGSISSPGKTNVLEMFGPASVLASEPGANVCAETEPARRKTKDSSVLDIPISDPFQGNLITKTTARGPEIQPVPSGIGQYLQYVQSTAHTPAFANAGGVLPLCAN
ncbi:MAG: hypothetical protein O2968_06175, partial [Acidobacteria bacterium]|nr:hypothetical protein [Acidobacteriota bacterium]